jgi:transposase InsO family protein
MKPGGWRDCAINRGRRTTIPTRWLRRAKSGYCRCGLSILFGGRGRSSAYLEREESRSAVPAVSTIGNVLKANGLTIPPKKRRRGRPTQQPLAHATEANRVWCADFKGWFRSGNGDRIDPLTISDAYSRYLLRCQAVRAADFGPSKPIFEAAFREYGLPDRIRTDNGAPFASNGESGLTGLSVWWIKLGIVPERIEPGKPQQNGRPERMHRTLKQATASPPASNRRAQQKRFDQFRVEYNEHRPHQALGQVTPGSCYAPSARLYPRRVAAPCGRSRVPGWLAGAASFRRRANALAKSVCIRGPRPGGRSSRVGAGGRRQLEGLVQFL